MAGTDSRFSAAQFREAIHFAMTMGLPDTTSERATFQWDTERDYAIADTEENPFDWSATPVTSVPISDLAVTCAVEFFSKGGDTQATHVGQFDAARAVLTLLDEEWEEVLTHSSDRLPNMVSINDSLYRVLFVGPPLGLFEVTVYQVYSQAIDEV